MSGFWFAMALIAGIAFLWIAGILLLEEGIEYWQLWSPFALIGVVILVSSGLAFTGIATT